jgi:uncharacterized glyoxalase superfamily protein PhnB
MKSIAHVVAGRASPGMRYRDVDAAIAFLCRAFGFEQRSAETDANGKTLYAELSFGSTIIMIAAASGFDLDRFMKQPGDIGGAETQCCYYVVDDIDQHYAKARSAGCEIVIDMQSRPNGARAFTCRDPEGHLWCFGTYDPWQSLSIAPDQPDPAPEAAALPSAMAAPASHRAPRFPARLAAALTMAALVSGSAAAWIYGEAWQTSRQATAAPTAEIGPERVISLELSKETFQSAIKDARRRLAVERRIRLAAERVSKAAQAEAAQEKSQRIAAEQTAKDLSGQLARAQEAADRAQNAASTAQDQLAKERGKADESARLARELEQARRTAANAHEELERAKLAQAAAEQEAKDTRARLTFVSHNAKESSEQAIAVIRKQLLDETAAREAAEREAKDAREELEHEQRLKQAAWQTVEQLKRRLAAAGVQATTGQSQRKKAASFATKTQAAAQPRATGASTAPKGPADKGWSLYGGPVFFKDTGSP